MWTRNYFSLGLNRLPLWYMLVLIVLESGNRDWWQRNQNRLLCILRKNIILNVVIPLTYLWPPVFGFVWSKYILKKAHYNVVIKYILKVHAAQGMQNQILNYTSKTVLNEYMSTIQKQVTFTKRDILVRDTISIIKILYL